MTGGETRVVPARWRVEWALMAAGVLVAAAGGIAGMRVLLWIGGGLFVFGFGSFAVLPHLFARPSRFVWWHQVAQLALCVGAAVIMWRRGAGWWGVAVVVALSFLMALSAGSEGRTVGVWIEQAAEARRRAEAEAAASVMWIDDDDDVTPPWERGDLGFPAPPSTPGPGLPKMPGDGNTY